jgi:2-keto-4-pentenoate hydratase/2-oxohepta-3-ene-1,7-dioic acid hydratase in catechol pathway
MKLATFTSRSDPTPRLGVVLSGRVFDATKASGVRSLKSLLGSTHGLPHLERLVGWASAGERSRDEQAALFVPEEDAAFLPPIPDPGKFLCVGKNYRAHLEELVRTDLIREIPSEPTGFIKLNAVLVGQDAAVARPPGIVQFDYEPELAFVIGKPAYRVRKEVAMQYVAGITAFNDLTAREIQKREVQSGTRFWTAKNMPGFGPIGPAMVTMDEIENVDDLSVTCSVNGELRSRFNTSGQIFKIPDIIEHFSRYLPLEPGDLFATGSAAGVAVAQPNASELFLKPGDQVEMSIETLLSLRTRIV